MNRNEVNKTDNMMNYSMQEGSSSHEGTSIPRQNPKFWKKPGYNVASNEQHRIQKMITGSNGMSFTDAVDEETDNGLDEGATELIYTFEGPFENCKLIKIENNGRPMCDEDRKGCLCLDSCNKKNKKDKKMKGKYGIGGSSARARLAGQGRQCITTKDGHGSEGICHQVVIDLKSLVDCDLSPPDCWSNPNSPFKPGEITGNWNIINDTSDSYIKGVTKEYIGGDSLQQKFDVKDFILHMIRKYAKQIKDGVVFNVCTKDKIYTIPYVYGNLEETEYKISYYDDNNGKKICETWCEDERIRVTQTPNRIT